MGTGKVLPMVLAAGLLLISGCAAPKDQGGVTDDPFGESSGPAVPPEMNPARAREPGGITRPLNPTPVLPQSGMPGGFTPGRLY